MLTILVYKLFRHFRYFCLEHYTFHGYLIDRTHGVVSPSSGSGRKMGDEVLTRLGLIRISILSALSMAIKADKELSRVL